MPVCSEYLSVLSLLASNCDWLDVFWFIDCRIIFTMLTNLRISLNARIIQYATRPRWTIHPFVPNMSFSIRSKAQKLINLDEDYILEIFKNKDIMDYYDISIDRLDHLKVNLNLSEEDINLIIHSNLLPVIAHTKEEISTLIHYYSKNWNLSKKDMKKIFVSPRGRRILLLSDRQRGNLSNLLTKNKIKASQILRATNTKVSGGKSIQDFFRLIKLRRIFSSKVIFEQSMVQKLKDSVNDKNKENNQYNRELINDSRQIYIKQYFKQQKDDRSIYYISTKLIESNLFQVKTYQEIQQIEKLFTKKLKITTKFTHRLMNLRPDLFLLSFNQLRNRLYYYKNIARLRNDQIYKLFLMDEYHDIPPILYEFLRKILINEYAIKSSMVYNQLILNQLLKNPKTLFYFIDHFIEKKSFFNKLSITELDYSNLHIKFIIDYTPNLLYERAKLYTNVFQWKNVYDIRYAFLKKSLKSSSLFAIMRLKDSYEIFQSILLKDMDSRLENEIYNNIFAKKETEESKISSSIEKKKNKKKKEKSIVEELLISKREKLKLQKQFNQKYTKEMEYWNEFVEKNKAVIEAAQGVNSLWDFEKDLEKAQSKEDGEEENNNDSNNVDDEDDDNEDDAISKELEADLDDSDEKKNSITPTTKALKNLEEVQKNGRNLSFEFKRQQIIDLIKPFLNEKKLSTKLTIDEWNNHKLTNAYEIMIKSKSLSNENSDSTNEMSGGNLYHDLLYNLAVKNQSNIAKKFDLIGQRKEYEQLTTAMMKYYQKHGIPGVDPKDPPLSSDEFWLLFNIYVGKEAERMFFQMNEARSYALNIYHPRCPSINLILERLIDYGMTYQLSTIELMSYLITQSK